MGGEITATIKGGLRKSAKEVLEHTDDLKKTAKNAEEAKQIDEVIEYLEEIHKFYDITGASGTIYKEVRTLEKMYTEGSKVNFERGVKYLNETERIEFEIFVQFDKIVDKNGKLFDTAKSVNKGIDGEIKLTNKSIFVMSENGKIYISKSNEYGKFHHSSFLAGEKVAAAGEIVIKKGVVKLINNCSGHYTPNIDTVKKNILTELDQRDYSYPTTDHKKESVIFKTEF